MGSRHRARDPRPAEDADEDVLPLRARVLRRAEHAHVPRLPRASRARCRSRTGRRSSGRSSSASRSAARSPTRPSSRARTTSIPTSRRATRSPSTTSRCASAARCSFPGPDGDREIGFVRAHLEEDAAKTIHVGGATGRKVGSRALARRLQPRRHAARRDRHAARHPLGRRGASASCSCCGRRSSSSASPTRRWRRARCASTRTSPSASAGSDGFRTRWELKNMNSFTFIARGIDAAVREQIELYESGASGRAADLDYEPDSDRLTPHRTKEEADDYRYFPEPDLVPVQPERGDWSSGCAAELPELPGARIVRLRERARRRRPRRRSSRVGSTRSGRRRRAGGRRARRGRERDREPARRRGRRSRARRRRRAREARSRRAPRSRAKTFDEAIARSGDEGFSADPYLEQKAVADTSRARADRRRGARRQPGTGRGVPRRQGRACSASSSAR